MILQSEDVLTCPKCNHPMRAVRMFENPRELDPLLDTTEIRFYRWTCYACGYADARIIEIDRIP